MSIVSDIRTRTEGALDQGRSVIETAQTRIGDAADDAQTSAKKFVSGARTQAEGQLNSALTGAKALVSEVPGVDVDKLGAQVDSYRKAVDNYRQTVTEKVEGLYNEVRHDKRVEKVADRVEALVTDVVGTVNDKIVEPVKVRLNRSSPVSDVTSTVADATPGTPVTPVKAPARKAAPRKTASPAAPKA